MHGNWQLVRFVRLDRIQLSHLYDAKRYSRVGATLSVSTGHAVSTLVACHYCLSITIIEDTNANWGDVNVRLHQPVGLI